jgi:signal peptidase I
MSDENKPHDEHAHDTGPAHDDHAPAAPAAGHDAPVEHAAGDHGHDAPAHDDHPVAEAHATDDHDHGHDDHAAVGVDAAHDDHSHDAQADHGSAEAAVAAGAGVTAAAAAAKPPVWSDSGDAPFEDVEATPVYARGKTSRKKSKSGGGNETFEIVKTIFFALLIALVLRVLLFQPFTIPSASMEPNLYEGDYIVVSKWSYGYSKHAIPFSPPLFEGRIFAQEPERGDIVVFKLPRDDRTDYVKRLIGLPGDRVQMINNVLHINNQPVRDVVLSEQDATNMYGMKVIKARETLPEGRTFTVQDFGAGYDADDTQVFEVPAGHYFMMGDNRDNSVDSRFDEMNGVGLVPAENLIGKAEIILFSWSPGASLWNPVSWFSKIRPSRFFTVLD